MSIGIMTPEVERAIAAVLPMCAAAEEIDYRRLCEDEHPELIELYDRLRATRSAEHAYTLIAAVVKEWKRHGIEEEKTHGTNMGRCITAWEFNPGGKHLRVEADGNIAERRSAGEEYAPRHLHAEEKEAPASPPWVRDARELLCGAR